MPHYPCLGRHPFGRLCDERGIEQRFTKSAHSWTNDQAEWMNRTLKAAPIKRFHYETADPLNTHLQTFLLAHNFAKRLKWLRGLPHYEFICAEWRKNSSSFI